MNKIIISVTAQIQIRWKSQISSIGRIDHSIVFFRRQIYILIIIGSTTTSMQQYYLHNDFINNGLRKNIKPAKTNNRQLLCMTNDNVIEFYEYTKNGIRYHAKHSINCNIAKVQILPCKQLEKDDYLFIVDKKGRYGVWSSKNGFEMVENSPIQNQCLLYKNELETDQVLFSGEIHHFDVFDTRGSVFFSYKHTIVVIDYTITRVGISLDLTRKFNVPYVQYRFIDWVKSSKKGNLLGIIEQIEERTILKVHNIQLSSRLSQQSLVFDKQKPNIFEFITQNDEIVMLSDDQVSGITIVRPYHYSFAYPIHNPNGKVVYLGQNTYCYIGQEMIVFNQEKLNSYGSFKQDGVNIFEKKGVMEAKCLKQTEDQGYLLSVSTLNNQTYFIVLHQNKWRLYYHLQALNSIYSIHPTTNNSAVIAVMDQAIDQYQIVLVQKQGLVPLVKQHECPATIDKLISIDHGRFIVVGSEQSNYILKYNEKNIQFDLVRELPKGNILLISNNIMITDTAIYSVAFDESFDLELNQESVVLTAHNNDKVVYMNAQGIVKQIMLEPPTINVLRDQAFDEYSWYLQKNNDLLVAKTSNLFTLYIHHQGGSISEIALQENCLISTLYNFTYQNDSIVEETIAVGYMNGTIYLYSMVGDLKDKISGYCNEPVSFFNVNSQLLGINSGSKQFILSHKNNTNSIKSIEFSKSYNSIASVVYLQMANQFIFVENDFRDPRKLLRMISLNDVYDGLNNFTNNHDSYRIKTIASQVREIPIVFLYQSFIIVGVSSHLLVYNTQSLRLVKTIPHYLKEVLGFMVLECGIIVYGIDSMERNLLYVYSRDLEELFFVNFIQKDNKYIKTLREIPNTNKFLCRGDTFTTLCQINSAKEIIEILEFKAEIQGYSLETDHNYSLLGETDSKRLLMVLSYANSILPIARYVSPSQINDFLLLQRCVLIGDKAGYLHLLQYNTEDPNEALRMNITNVASINVGQEVTALSKKSSHEAFYGTVSGRIGSLQVIAEEAYRALKPAEEERFAQLRRGHDFQYAGWRGRNMADDKLIDGALIRQFLHDKSRRILNENQRATYEQVRSLFEELSI